MEQTHRLILASGSAARRTLMEKAGLFPEVMPSGFDEPGAEACQEPRVFVQQMAWFKARAVALAVQDTSLIIAADSIVWHQGKAILKPKDESDARRILSSLAGTTHELWTGVCCWRRPDDLQLEWQELSRVRMKALSTAELDGLLRSGSWRDKSGGYGIQEEGIDPFLTVEEGTLSNVIGLPMESLLKRLPWAIKAP